jgi:flagellar basal body-associated protein FliL
MSRMTSQVRIAGIVGLALVALAAAAQPLHHEVTPAKAFAILGIVVPAALLPALLVRYAVARRWVPLLLLIVAGLIAGTAAVGWLASKVNVKPIHPRTPTGGGGTVTGQAPNSGFGTLTNRPSSGHVSVSSSLILVLLLALGLVVIVAIVAALRRQPPPTPVATPRRARPEPEPEEMVRRFYSLIDDTLDDLRAEPDPRTAVIAAYARMEGGLGALGVERMLSETPFEYLARVLEKLSVSDAAARQLTELFERAKFGAGPVDETMKEQAVSALETIREEARAWRA